MIKNKLVYIASPYSAGDKKLNVQFQINVFAELMHRGYTPIAPLLTHFVHQEFPADYLSWLALDFTLIQRCDALVALDAEVGTYVENHSPGRDVEVEFANGQGIPVYHSLEELFDA